MADAFDSETMANTVDCQDQTTHKIRERRNGMGNIFEGIDRAVLEKLGLSEEIVHKLNPEGDETLTHCVSYIVSGTVASFISLPPDKSIMHRSRAIFTEEMELVLKKRGRRNALANILEPSVLYSPQQLLLIEQWQARQLQYQEELAIINDAFNSRANNTGNSCDTDLASPPACSVVRGPSATHGQIVCSSSQKITTVVCPAVIL